jgi:hypothetical protein
LRAGQKVVVPRVSAVSTAATADLFFKGLVKLVKLKVVQVSAFPPSCTRSHLGLVREITFRGSAGVIG